MFLNSRDNTEIKGLTGLLYIRAVLKKSSINLDDMFCETCGSPIFCSTMSQRRFSFFLKNLRFDVKKN